MNIERWKKTLLESVRNGSGEFDPDSPPCPECGRDMKFIGHDAFGDFGRGDGYWKCPSCGFRITEGELY